MSDTPKCRIHGVPLVYDGHAWVCPLPDEIEGLPSRVAVTPSAVPVEATTREPESCKCGSRHWILNGVIAGWACQVCNRPAPDAVRAMLNTDYGRPTPSAPAAGETPTVHDVARALGEGQVYSNRPAAPALPSEEGGVPKPLDTLENKLRFCAREHGRIAKTFPNSGASITAKAREEEAAATLTARLSLLEQQTAAMRDDAERWRYVRDKLFSVENDTENGGQFLFMHDDSASTWDVTFCEGDDNTVDSLIDQRRAALNQAPATPTSEAPDGR